MKMLIRLKNGNTTSIPGVLWHDEYTSCFGTHFPAKCYVMASSLKTYNDTYNKQVHKTWIDVPDRSFDDFINMIDCAEMPFDIIEDHDSEEPWKDFGVILKEVHRGMSDMFWRNHA